MTWRVDARPPSGPHGSCFREPPSPTDRGGSQMQGSALNAADVAWMMIATALVLLMTPALGFFYGGLVRGKNALNTLMMSVAATGFVGLAWALVGYSLAFAPGSALVGGFSQGLLRGVGLEAQGTIPHLLFMAYQGTFAIVTA